MRAWADAVADWEYSGGEGSLQCRACGARTPVHRWKHEPLWVFGNLALVFWNWPELREDFIERVSKLLGHRVVVVRGTF